MMRLDEKLRNHQSHPEGDITVCNIFKDIHPIVVDISLKTTNISLMVALEERSGGGFVLRDKILK